MKTVYLFGVILILFVLVNVSFGLLWNALDLRYWRCVWKRSTTCPDPEVKFYMYTERSPRGKRIDVTSQTSLRLGGWDQGKRNVIIIHGFNSTQRKAPMTIIRDAYLSRGDYNVFTVDWEPLTIFPCYLSALSNTRLVAQCAAQMYAHLTASGARSIDTTCVGHSLGAHICGMINNHLDSKMHKIIGLDPARPLVDRYGTRSFRLTRDDAHVVQVIHTNMGMLGEEPLVGHADVCVNGGRIQPTCRGHRLRRARCSHFLSACYLATAVVHPGRHWMFPCPNACRGRASTLNTTALAPTASPASPAGRKVPFGEDMPEYIRGTYCLGMRLRAECPFD